MYSRIAHYNSRWGRGTVPGMCLNARREAGDDREKRRRGAEERQTGEGRQEKKCQSRGGKPRPGPESNDHSS